MIILAHKPLAAIEVARDECLIVSLYLLKLLLGDLSIVSPGESVILLPFGRNLEHKLLLVIRVIFGDKLIHGLHLQVGHAADIADHSLTV